MSEHEVQERGWWGPDGKWYPKENLEWKDPVDQAPRQRFKPLPVAPLSTGVATKKRVLPPDSMSRKDIPVCTGVLDYFPDAIAAVAEVSRVGNDQHNPGQPLHWAREKSTDHSDCIMRHLMERGTKDTDGMRHSAKLAWRALALLQVEIEAERG